MPWAVGRYVLRPEVIRYLFVTTLFLERMHPCVRVASILLAILPTNISVGLQFFYNLAHRLASLLNFIGRKRNCAHHRMTAASVAFTNRGDIVGARAWRPRI